MGQMAATSWAIYICRKTKQKTKNFDMCNFYWIVKHKEKTLTLTMGNLDRVSPCPRTHNTQNSQVLTTQHMAQQTKGTLDVNNTNKGTLYRCVFRSKGTNHGWWHHQSSYHPVWRARTGRRTEHWPPTCWELQPGRSTCYPWSRGRDSAFLLPPAISVSY